MPKIDQYLEVLVESGASDFHLSSGSRPVFRLDGDIRSAQDTDEMTSDMVVSLIEEIMPERNKDEFQKCFDTDFAYEIKGVARFRVNVFMDLNGVGTVIRKIPVKILSADELGLPQSVRNFCSLNKGLVVVTGPTGSGKSTTLAAMIDLINQTRSAHIITIEDPVEFVHTNKSCLINHREVHRHTSGFKNALRAALREDPDIILIGEMRDLETVEIAIETAETGHLVFGTLHTTTAYSTIDRIIGQFPADRQAQIRAMLSESLKGVVAQTLVKKKGGGRAAAMEILCVIPSVSNLIREAKIYQIPSIMQTSRKLGMSLLNDALLDLVVAGTVEPREAWMKAVDKGDLEPRLRAAGFALP